MRTVNQVREHIERFLADEIYPHVSGEELKQKKLYLSYLLDEFERVKEEYVHDDIRFRLEGVI